MKPRFSFHLNVVSNFCSADFIYLNSNSLTKSKTYKILNGGNKYAIPSGN